MEQDSHSLNDPLCDVLRGLANAAILRKPLKKLLYIWHYGCFLGDVTRRHQRISCNCSDPWEKPWGLCLHPPVGEKRHDFPKKHGESERLRFRSHASGDPCLFFCMLAPHVWCYRPSHQPVCYQSGVFFSSFVCASSVIFYHARLLGLDGDLFGVCSAWRMIISIISIISTISTIIDFVG